jgi:hypothetical protein
MASSAKAEGYATASPAHTFATITTADPTRFYPRHGIIPGVVTVSDQTGAWDAAGQRRVLALSDGGTFVERTREVDAPRRFTYQLTDFTGRFGGLVAFADAEWDFDAAVEGTRVRWRYTFHAQPKRGWIVRLIVKLAWARYMRRVLPGLLAEAG